jgi:hypothetical protein
MAKLKLEHLRADLVADFRAILKAWRVENLIPDLQVADAWRLLHKVSRDRAYDNSHPTYIGKAERVLPFDGRKYCFYYENGANDSHVASLLKAVLSDLQTSK